MDFEYRLAKIIRESEGSRRKVYDDATGLQLNPGEYCRGNPSIGIGRNLHGKGLSADEIEYLFRNDLSQAKDEAAGIFGDLETFDEPRRAVLIELTFQMGRRRLLGFRKMIAAVKEGDWQRAAFELSHSGNGASSDYFKQLPKRCRRQCDALQNGRWPD